MPRKIAAGTAMLRLAHTAHTSRMRNADQQVQAGSAAERGDERESKPSRRQQMLLEFLRECDADPPERHPACPVCGYSLKALTKPVCPECGQELALAVGAPRLRLGLLFAAVAPGFFSGIAACFVLIPIFGRLWFGDGRTEPVIIGLDLFGWFSAACAIMLATRWRAWFLAQSRRHQVMWALLIWFLHVAALGAFIGLARAYL